MYVATRDLGEQGSTALHLDATSAVNVMVYSSSGDPQVPGALWHIFRPEDSDSIRTYLLHKGLYTQEEDPIHARKTYITRSMRLELAALNIRAFEIFQRPGDAVFIPAGCAHQVRFNKPRSMASYSQCQRRLATYMRASRWHVISFAQKGSRTVAPSPMNSVARRFRTYYNCRPCSGIVGFP